MEVNTEPTKKRTISQVDIEPHVRERPAFTFICHVFESPFPPLSHTLNFRLFQTQTKQKIKEKTQKKKLINFLGLPANSIIMSRLIQARLSLSKLQ